MGPPPGAATDPPSPIDLVRSAARGDQASIETLLERHLPALRAFVHAQAGARIRARDATSDLVQSICVQALEGAESIRAPDEEGFRRWLYTAALRVIYARNRYHRAEKRAVEAEAAAPRPDPESSSPPGELAGGSPTPSRVLRGREDLASVEAAFAQLSEEQREVILLSRLGDFSHADLAAHFGCTEEAVRQRLSRALARLWTLARREPT